MDKDKVYTLEYKMDLDDVKQIIQEETKFVEEGWIPDSKEDRRNAIEWGLKVLQLFCPEVNFLLTQFSKLPDMCMVIEFCFLQTYQQLLVCFSYLIHESPTVL